MNKALPLVSIIMATYNRAKTLRRAVDSVLNQTYRNFELIIIDDGSTDNTSQVLGEYDDPRIRIYVHNVNKGATAAKNSGLKQIKGEWFGTFDSDDELLPDAIETLMNVPLNLDNNITSVLGNGVDFISGELTGKGLTHDGYINGNEILSFTEGDFWGLIKTSLLQNDLFNENTQGFEEILWSKINSRANKYYVHQPLDIIHTEGEDRVSRTKFNLIKKKILYENLIEEEFYLEVISRYRPFEFYKICRDGILIMNATGRRNVATKYYQLFLKYSKRKLVIELVDRFRMFSLILRVYSSLKTA
jgi:glycosyltransferase involved in cell wall biosynthesis